MNIISRRTWAFGAPIFKFYGNFSTVLKSEEFQHFKTINHIEALSGFLRLFLEKTYENETVKGYIPIKNCIRFKFYQVIVHYVWNSLRHKLQYCFEAVSNDRSNLGCHTKCSVRYFLYSDLNKNVNETLLNFFQEKKNWIPHIFHLRKVYLFWLGVQFCAFEITIHTFFITLPNNCSNACRKQSRTLFRRDLPATEPLEA